MRHLFYTSILIFFFQGNLTAQMNRRYKEDSLRAILVTTPMDTARVNILNKLAGSYFFKRPDSTLFYAQEALALARKLDYTLGIQLALFRSGEANRQLGNLVEAMKIQTEAVEFNRKVKSVKFEANSLGWLGMDYFELHDYKKAQDYLKQALALRQTLPQREPTEPLFNIHLGYIYTHYRRPDSAFYFFREANKYRMMAQLRILRAMGVADVYVQINKMDSARYYYRRALKYIFEDQDNAPNHLSLLGIRLSKVFDLQNQPDSSLYFARYAFFIAKKKKLNLRVLEASNQLAQIFKSNRMLDSALYYQDISIALNDTIFGQKNVQELQLLLLDEQRRIQEIEQAEDRHQNNVRLISLVTITAVILVASIILFRSNRIKQKTNLALQRTLKELRSAQSQLVQSEKMASLGELTAGIAHEIQNPLNFVNNFSEVNKELIEELTQQASEGNLKEVQKLANNIKDNEDKIEQHGKRADAIVKSMLQHSRASSGKKELTDINALFEEYSRLAYHGYRAKDKSFNAKLDIDFDKTLPPIQAIPQDIGRVILNLINNAFYAVSEKKKTSPEDYTPTVWISTKNLGNKIEIKVKDNGAGITEKVKEKMFQPFFTTKPTGQGTGLGLSLSYDIVKAHGGEFFVQTNEGSGSEFIIQLSQSI